MSNSEDPNALSIIFVGLMGAVGVFLVVILLQIVFFRMQENETARKVVSMAPEELATLRAQQQANLNGYGWVNQDERVVHIPIERAMELTVQDINHPPEPAAIDALIRLADPLMLAIFEDDGDITNDLDAALRHLTPASNAPAAEGEHP